MANVRLNRRMKNTATCFDPVKQTEESVKAHIMTNRNVVLTDFEVKYYNCSSFDTLKTFLNDSTYKWYKCLGSNGDMDKSDSYIMIPTTFGNHLVSARELAGNLMNIDRWNFMTFESVKVHNFISHTKYVIPNVDQREKKEIYKSLCVPGYGTTYPVSIMYCYKVKVKN